MSKPIFENPLKDNHCRIIDGDTIEILLDRGWNEQKTTNLRLVGLNSPESRTRRVLEKKAGLLVKQLVTNWIEKRKTTTCLYASSEEKPKYAGRTIGRLWADDPADCLNSYLLQLEVVKPYSGGAREKFTDEELNIIIEKCEHELK